jgi:hypothetical protein
MSIDDDTEIVVVEGMVSSLVSTIEIVVVTIGVVDGIVDENTSVVVLIALEIVEVRILAVVSADTFELLEIFIVDESRIMGTVVGKGLKLVVVLKVLNIVFGEVVKIVDSIRVVVGAKGFEVAVVNIVIIEVVTGFVKANVAKV